MPKFGRPALLAQNPMLAAVFLPPGHKIEFSIGQSVYLKTDREQQERMLTGISLRPNRSVTYCLALGSTETWHYGIEIDSERDVLKATTG